MKKNRKGKGRAGGIAFAERKKNKKAKAKIASKQNCEQPPQRRAVVVSRSAW
jgi:hypothetical protein